MAHTPEERTAVVRELLDSKGLSPKDKLLVYILWIRYEYALRRRTHHNNMLKKLSERLNNFIEIHNFTRDLEKLS